MLLAVVGRDVGLLLARLLSLRESCRHNVTLGASIFELYFIKIEDGARRLVNTVVVLLTDMDSRERI